MFAMKRLTQHFSPIQSGSLVKPLNDIVNISVDQFWVWCLTADQLLKRQHSRRGLESLTEEQLCDIGLTRTEAQKELDKWFWQE